MNALTVPVYSVSRVQFFLQGVTGFGAGRFSEDALQGQPFLINKGQHVLREEKERKAHGISHSQPRGPAAAFLSTELRVQGCEHSPEAEGIKHILNSVLVFWYFHIFYPSIHSVAKHWDISHQMLQ